MIYVTDVPPSSSDFAAVQWWGNQGGLHGLVELESPRKAKNITGQYFDAFPDHAAELDKPLTRDFELDGRSCCRLDCSLLRT